MMELDKEGSGAKMEPVRVIQHQLFRTISNKDVTFYNQQKEPLWSGFIDDTWSNSADITKPSYVSAINVQTWNKNGSPRKGSATRKGKTQIFPGYYYSFGLTPEGVTPQPEAAEAVLTQAQVDAKLKEYVTQRLMEELRWKNDKPGYNAWDNEALNNWHIPEAFVTIFKELTE